MILYKETPLRIQFCKRADGHEIKAVFHNLHYGSRDRSFSKKFSSEKSNFDDIQDVKSF